MSSHGIRKVVIPAAGLGSRFLPATKVVPKELLPIADKPMIQFAVEEAVASGLDRIILVIGRGKNLVADHFHRNFYMERMLEAHGQGEDAALIRQLCEMAEVHTVWQDSPLGLADAVRSARSVVGDEPFAVILPDALIDAPTPCIGQLLSCYEKHAGCVVATQAVAPQEVDRYGILDVVPMPDPCCGGRTLRVISLTERPQPGSTVSLYGIFGRYVLDPDIFSCIDHTEPGLGGELQLTDALHLYSGSRPLFAYRFDGVHYDAGSKLGFLEANVAFALKDPALGGPLREHLAGKIADFSHSPLDLAV
ncbi:MAG: UTP--glucose-1-phosphate uridylyltransferase [Acidobacteria bacterium]|nr:UTP--glucose-1-phosphate uridylyltransferase [Acidobacteriota bacterium]